MIKQYINNFIPTQGEKLWSNIKQQCTIYKEYLPCKELQSHIACYWTSKTNNISNKPISSRIIPDGCMDIVFNIEEINKGKCGLVSGLMTMPEEQKVKGISEFIGVRFWPGEIIPFLKNSANDFTNQLIPLDSILGKVAFDISEKLYFEVTLSERLMIIEEELVKLLLKASVSNKLIKSALCTIYQHKGIISIRSLSKEMNISQRQLSRKFKTWIGTNPKTFINIIRFQYIIKQLNERTNINFQDLALENGYYDQAHFIKEFKALYGKTPGKL
ncbi:AraC family transcriptional regulator [Maledivibacter halophilus]|uniref:AraC-type DNA-binding domain-containing proteins n=1 Tax=Maledivibacter halophilus TaxID=36842 RepID=A0A1T5KRQ1_9FIRM|nr:helix-turn-helix domain-containing protein [Maledivibacter halophilus]SKC66099.1 AraC-type DNA-binding domain-containing proteins [Maledivibacter halophilus]